MNVYKYVAERDAINGMGACKSLHLHIHTALIGVTCGSGMILSCGLLVLSSWVLEQSR